MIGDKLNYLELVKHTLLDAFEFSAHTDGEVFGVHTLNGVGIDFSVGFDEESVLKNLRASGCKKAFFAHTHPLINDNSLYFQKGKADPRKLIASGQKLLPLGNCPTNGDIEYFQKFKQKAKQYGIEIVGVVFSASGVWIFNTKEDLFLKDEKIEKKKGSDDFFDYLNIKGMYPSYSMEIIQPKIRTKVEYAFEVGNGLFAKFWTKIKSPFYKMFLKFKVRRIIKSFSKQGVLVEFIDYKSKGVDPVVLLRLGIEEWERER